MKNAKVGGLILATHPGLTGLGILALALAIGANTSVFNIVNAMTLGPHCPQAPERLVTVLTNHPVSTLDKCPEVETVESKSHARDENSGFESSAPAEISENGVRSIAGNEAALTLRSELPGNQSAGSRCGQSRNGRNDLATAARGGHVLRLPAEQVSPCSHTGEARIFPPIGDQESATVPPRTYNQAEVSDCVTKRHKS